MAKDISGLRVGGRDGARYSGKAYLGATFRNMFTREDMEAFAVAIKGIINNPDEKTADRLKALDLVLKKLVADEVPEDTASVKSLDEIKELLKTYGFELKPITKANE